VKKVLAYCIFCSTSLVFADVEVLRSADRPQLTEKPQTVGPGMFQLEGSALEYGYEKDGGYKRHNVDVLSLSAKYGLTNVLDIFTSFDVFRHFNPSNLQSKSGIGDVRLGAEYNIWGNRDYNSALSVVPFVKIPSNTHNYTNDAIEFGVKAPFTLELKDEFTFGAMIEVDIFEDVADADGYHFELVNSVSITKPLADPIAMYVEYYSRNTFEDDMPWASLLGVGAVYATGEKLLLDATMRVGLSEAAEDVRFIVGGSYRF